LDLPNVSIPGQHVPAGSAAAASLIIPLSLDRSPDRRFRIHFFTGTGTDTMFNYSPTAVKYRVRVSVFLSASGKNVLISD
jgi:hypothetical protein